MSSVLKTFTDYYLLTFTMKDALAELDDYVEFRQFYL